MQLPLSEPVPLLPGMVARVQHVRQTAQVPAPERFLHFHGPAELVVIEEGEGLFLCENAQFPFSPGTVLFAPAMAIHDFAFEKGARAWTLIQFDPHAVNRESVVLPSSPQAVHLDPDTLMRTKMLADWLAQSIAAQSPQRAVAVQLHALALAVVHAFEPDLTDSAEAPSSLSKFRPLLNQLSGDPAKTLTLSEAATLCAMSPAYFSRCFTRTFAIGFNAYQTRLKLEQAARILATSTEPVSQIGYRLGFHSHAYFSYCFKTLFGVTPSSHRSCM